MVYYASKAFVLSFTEDLREEVIGTPLRVTCLCPGPTATEFAAGAGLEGKPLFRLKVTQACDVARAGHRGFRRGKLIVVPGLVNRLGAFSVRFSPRSVARQVAKRLQE